MQAFNFHANESKLAQSSERVGKRLPSVSICYISSDKRSISQYASTIQAIILTSSHELMCVHLKAAFFCQGREINVAAYRLAREVADEGDALVSISLTEPMSYRQGAGEEQVKAELRQQLQFFIDEHLQPDFVACEVSA